MKKTLYTLRIRAKAQEQDNLLGILTEYAPYGWEEHTLPDNVLECVVYAENQDFLTPLQAAAQTEKLEYNCEKNEIPDPLDAWKKFFTPVVCGANFVVLPPWLKDEQFAAPHKIIIEPKSAFGTGHHASTTLCLEALSWLLEQKKIKPGDSFLDLGCGSGVLGIAASLAGLKGVAADIDPLATDNAMENCALNNTQAMRIITGGIEQTGAEKFNLIMANILAGPLIEMAPQITGHLAGCLVLSGILATQAEQVSLAYQKNGLGQPKEMRKEEWSALIWS